MRKHLHISALDTLMFRDGRPFNQADSGASRAVSVFPPLPPTLVGAIRAMLWQGALHGKWDTDKLGDGTNWQSDNNILNPLSFGPPLLLKDGQPVFPMPLHIVKGNNGDGVEKYTRLKPGAVRTTDRGEISLPIPQDDTVQGIKTLEDCFVTLSGMKKILGGGVPDKEQIIKRKDLWSVEPRVGIGIDPKTRITSDGELYMASHIRMAEDVSLCVKMNGWDNEINTALRPLAGEHRFAEIKAGDAVTLPSSQPGDGAHMLIAISPVVPDENGNITGIDDSKTETACLGKTIPIGGWNSKDRAPIPLRRCIPTGSVWFMKDGSPPSTIGAATEWGFGHVLAGKYEE